MLELFLFYGYSVLLLKVRKKERGWTVIFAKVHPLCLFVIPFVYLSSNSSLDGFVAMTK